MTEVERKKDFEAAEAAEAGVAVLATVAAGLGEVEAKNYDEV